LVPDAGDGAALAPVDGGWDGLRLASAVQVEAGAPPVGGVVCRRVLAAALLEAEDAAAELLQGEVGEGGEAEAEAMEP